MLDSSLLKDLIAEGDDAVSFDLRGDRIELPAPESSPALMVRSVPDALKTVSERGYIEDSVDRAQVWSVEGFVLSAEITAQLRGRFESPIELYRAVQELGYEWAVSPMSSDL